MPPELVPAGRLEAGLLALLLVIRDAQRDGTWLRLKACGNPDCRWAFYDRSHSRAGAWCDMATCGNRIKTAGSGNQRRYEAVRAYVYKGAALGEAAARFGYTPSALASLARDFRPGKLALFAEPGKPGRKSAPGKDAARGFAAAYADRNERDHDALVAAVTSGRITAEPGL